MDFFLGFDSFARAAHRTQRDTFISLLKGIIKGRDEQSDEEIHRMRSGRVPSAGTSVPVELR